MRVKILASVLGVLMLGACSPSQAEPIVVPSKTTTKQSTQVILPSESAVPSEYPVPEPEEGAKARFGVRYAYPDGLLISVSKPIAFDPSADAEGEGKNNVKFVVTYANSSNSAFDPSHVTMRVLSQGSEGSDVYDPANGLRGEWDTSPIPPGKTRYYVVGASVKSSEEVQVSILSNLDKYDSITFSG